MSVLNIVLSILVIIFFSISLFLGKEMMKKFGFMKAFVMDSNQLLELNFAGAKRNHIKIGMHKTTIEWDRPFSALIGFNLAILGFGNGFDYYGFVKATRDADGNYRLTISTYLGNRPVDFRFYLNQEITGNEPIFNLDPNQRRLVEPMAVFPPHWWQRLSFLA